MTPTDFAALMTRELEANAHKGDWTKWKPGQTAAMRELTYHVGKLDLALRAGDHRAVLEFCGDVGNLTMKIAELFGSADTPPQLPP